MSYLGDVERRLVVSQGLRLAQNSQARVCTQKRPAENVGFGAARKTPLLELFLRWQQQRLRSGPFSPTDRGVDASDEFLELLNWGENEDQSPPVST